MADATIYNLLGQAENALQLYKAWDLQDAQYNGVNFYIARYFGSGSITNAIDIANSASSYFRNASDYPKNKTLPLGTKEYLQEIRDAVKRKLITHQLFNSNTNIIEDVGFGVEKFNGIGIIIGENYYDAYKELYNAFMARADSNIDARYRNVLQHPIRGQIDNVFLENFKVIHSSERWRGILFEFTFLAQSITTIPEQDTITSTIINVNDIFNLIIASVNTLLTIIGQIEGYGNMISSYFNSTSPNNAINFMNQTLPQIKQSTIPLLVNTSTLLYNNFKPQNYTNYYFENQNVNYSEFPELKGYANGGDNASINYLLQLYNKNVLTNIEQINNYGLNIQANDLIEALKDSYVNLLDLATQLATSNNTRYFSYKLPYTMSIREVCFNNELDFNNPDVIASIMTSNYGLFASVNKIDKDITLLLPRM